MSTRTLPVYVFFSGACALLYQTVWQRELRLIFGASTAASGAVLAAFIGGLGAGSLLLARRVERSNRPFRLYGLFELGIAISAAVTPLLLQGVRASYVAVGGTQALGDAGGTAVRVVLSALVLFIPTFLMGGTLPAVARAVTDDTDTGRRQVAILYGVNTLGAVIGCALATFVVLERLGSRGALWAGCAVNLAVALLAIAHSRRLPDVAAPAGAPADPAPGAASVNVPRSLVLAAAFIVGAVFFLMELVWFRMLSPLLGGSVFTFGLVLCVALAGIGLGGAFAGRLARAGPPTVFAFALTCLLEAAAMAVPFAAGDTSAFFALILRPLAAQGLAGSVAAWTAVSLFVVFPAAFIAGVQFPLLIALAGRARAEVAHHVGLVYAANTVGSVVGSLAGGFGLMPWLSGPGTWRLAGGLLVALGLASIAVAGSGARRLLPVALAALSVACLLSPGPTAVWRHTPIGAGRVPTDVVLPGAREGWARSVRRDTVWEQDGVEVSVALNATDGLAFVVSGKVDGNALGDVATQVMSGVFGAFLHPDPKQVLVIGLGTGSTAGWLADLPSVERVDVMELEPAILEVARRMPEINRDVMKNPKVRHLLGDARELLATSRERYDVLFSEPSNPYRAGIANLYTKEFYEAARDHLRDDGVFIQFLQSYEVDGAVIRSVYATLSAVFGSVETWCGKSGDLLLIGSKRPIAIDVARLRAQIATEPIATALRVGWGVDTAEGVFAHHVAGPDFTRWLVAQAQPPINTDDANRIEFGFARSVGAQMHQRGDLSALVARFYGARSPLPPGLDPQRLALESFVFMAGGHSRAGAHAVPPATLDASSAGRARAMLAWSRGELPEVEAAWPADVAPATALERLVKYAAGFRQPVAGRADEASALKAMFPVDVALVDAFGALARREDPAAALEAAFGAHRVSPWAGPGLMRRALAVAVEPGRDRAFYERMAVALAEPFAASSLESDRREAFLQAVALTGNGEACARAYEALGDDVPWTRHHLGVRRACFEAKRPALAEAARRDLERFEAQQPRMVSTGLP